MICLLRYLEAIVFRDVQIRTGDLMEVNLGDYLKGLTGGSKSGEIDQDKRIKNRVD
jgi:hypothetical protein